MPDFTVKFPLEFSNESNGFNKINLETIKEMVVFNLKNIILTNPGERLMNPAFGVGIKRFLFEQENVPNQEIEFRIRSQVKLYASYVKIIDMQFNMISNALQIILKYHIKEMDISDVLILDVNL